MVTPRTTVLKDTLRERPWRNFASRAQRFAADGEPTCASAISRHEVPPSPSSANVSFGAPSPSRSLLGESSRASRRAARRRGRDPLPPPRLTRLALSRALHHTHRPADGLSRDKRRSYKCALREIEGAYEKGKEPSAKGLPEATDFGKKKRKADEEAPEDIKAVPADEMAALVFKMKTYAGAALCPQASRVITVSTWAPAYFEAVLTRDFYSAHRTALVLCPS